MHSAGTSAPASAAFPASPSSGSSLSFITYVHQHTFLDNNTSSTLSSNHVVHAVGYNNSAFSTRRFSSEASNKQLPANAYSPHQPTSKGSQTTSPSFTSPHRDRRLHFRRIPLIWPTPSTRIARTRISAPTTVRHYVCNRRVQQAQLSSSGNSWPRRLIPAPP